MPSALPIIEHAYDVREQGGEQGYGRRNMDEQPHFEQRSDAKVAADLAELFGAFGQKAANTFLSFVNAVFGKARESGRLG